MALAQVLLLCQWPSRLYARTCDLALSSPSEPIKESPRCRKDFYLAGNYYFLAMPELMINAGWTETETVNQYKPRLLHALNALSDCNLEKPVALQEVVDMIDKPAAFNPTRYKTIKDTEADAILNRIMSELIEENYLSKRGDSLFATTHGLEKRKATDPYWKKTTYETYDCE